MKRESLITLASTIAVTVMLLTLLQPVMAARNPTPMSPSPWKKWVKDYQWTPLLDESPYGRFNVIVSIYKIKEDGVSEWDWYFYELKLQSVPGNVAYGFPYWRTNEFWAWHKVDFQRKCISTPVGTFCWDNSWLVDYGPTTTSGQTSVTYTLSCSAGPSGPGAGFSMGYTYSIPDVTVIDISDYSENRAEWIHDIYYWSNAALYTYQAKPGFVVKTLQDEWSKVKGRYSIKFSLYVGYGVYLDHTLGPTAELNLNAREIGD